MYINYNCILKTFDLYILVLFIKPLELCLSCHSYGNPRNFRALNRKHSNNLRFVCDYCGMQFLKRQQKKRHLNRWLILLLLLLFTII